MKNKSFTVYFVRHFILILCAISMVVPLFWMLSTALKGSDKIFSYPPEWIPRQSVYKGETVTIFNRKPGKVKVELTSDIVFTPVWRGKCYEPQKIASAGDRMEIYTDELSETDNHAQVERKITFGKDNFWAIYKVNCAVKVLEHLSESFCDVRFTDGRIECNVPSKFIKTEISLRWSNFSDAWKAVPFARYYFNSLFVATCVTLGQLITCSMAAFAFARLHFPLRDKVFFLYLMTLMIPAQVTMIPLFILMTKLSMVDTYFALIIPPMFSAYGTFMLRQFFITLPRELEEAACIDGCGLWKIFTVVILPLSKPALATLGIFTFMGNWNSFVWPLIITNSESLKTLPVGLASFSGQYSTDWSLLMAACVMMIAPLIAVFIFGQRFFIKGIQMGALKG